MNKPRLHIGLIGIMTWVFILSTAMVPRSSDGYLRVEFEGESKTEYLSKIERKDVLYVAAGELARILGNRFVYVPQNRKLVITIGARSMKLTGANPFIMVDDKAYQIPLPTLDTEGEIYVPLILFLKTVGSHFPEKMTFEHDREILKVKRTLFNITGIEVEEKLNGSLIRFVTTEQFTRKDISVSIQNERWLYVNFNKGKLDSVRMASDQARGIVKRVIPFTFDSSAQITLELKQKIADRPEVTINHDEVTVSLRSPKEFETIDLAGPSVDNKRWLIDTIILDPGHGGKRKPGGPGAVGRKYGTLEKTIVLDIAKRLKTLLQKEGFKVLMTREDDSIVTLSERTKFANTNKGKLFISIHANGNPKSRYRGYSTYYLGKSNKKEKEAAEIADTENSVIELEDSQKAYKQYRDGSFILNMMAQSENQKESQDFARMINKHMKRKTKLPQFYNGVYQNWFYVLVGASMPAVLVETAFLTNTYDEQFLRTNVNRQRIAEALRDAVVEFRQKYEKGIG